MIVVFFGRSMKSNLLGVEESFSYYFQLVIMLRVGHSMFCHKNDHAYLIICQCEIFSQIHFEEPPYVVYKTGEHEQEISYEAVC